MRLVPLQMVPAFMSNLCSLHPPRIGERDLHYINLAPQTTPPRCPFAPLHEALVLTTHRIRVGPAFPTTHPSAFTTHLRSLFLAHVSRGCYRSYNALAPGHPHVDLPLNHPELVLFLIHQEARALLGVADERETLGDRVKQMIHLWLEVGIACGLDRVVAVVSRLHRVKECRRRWSLV